MSDPVKPPLPPPTPALSVVKLLALVWFLFLAPREREKLIKILEWVSRVFAGPEQNWPLDFGRPLSEAVEVIECNRSAARWVGELATQFKVVSRRLPPDLPA